jgi:hypothetical protein
MRKTIIIVHRLPKMREGELRCASRQPHGFAASHQPLAGFDSSVGNDVQKQWFDKPSPFMALSVNSLPRSSRVALGIKADIIGQVGPAGPAAIDPHRSFVRLDLRQKMPTLGFIRWDRQ